MLCLCVYVISELCVFCALSKLTSGLSEGNALSALCEILISAWLPAQSIN